ncbi:MAG: hypothetical protein LBE47_01180 [Methanomassiliicoccaceae archaeon]|jgi:hypothetical protein|nr:hypothetical protein [Methanomassiliicoccaceae archaeon]
MNQDDESDPVNRTSKISDSKKIVAERIKISNDRKSSAEDERELRSDLSQITLPNGVKVTFDSSVLISYIGSKDGNRLADKVINKAKIEDIPIITNILLEECTFVAERKRTRKGQITASMEEVHLKLKSIGNIIQLPLISDEELK